MDDTEFFKDEAERFLSHARVTSNQSLQETLLSFSSGFADYANELEKRRAMTSVAGPGETSATPESSREAPIAPGEGPDTIVLEACTALIASVRGDEIATVPAFDSDLIDQEWSLDEHVDPEPDHCSAREKCVFLAVIMAPTMGLLFWTLANFGR